MRYFVLVWVCMVLCASPPAWGYNHEHAHKRINELSFEAFVREVKNDPWGKHKEYDLYDFKTKGPELTGFMVTTPGDTEVVESKVAMSMKDWIISGGYTADEPELLSALRHFYDPLSVARDSKTGKPVRYLTDFADPWIKKLGMWWFGTHEAKMDAREWGIVGPARGPYKENRYSFKKGLWYMRRAMEEKSPRQKQMLYAGAWRALGETMHLMADMTVPAHVRNDAHPKDYNLSGLKTDPYEYYVRDNSPELGDVILSASRHGLDPAVATIVETAPDVWVLFDRIARFTNKNFFSADTLSGRDPTTGKMIKPANNQSPYPSPKLEKCKLDPMGYFVCNGRITAHEHWADNTWWNTRNALRQRMWHLVGWKNKVVSYQEVCVEQANTLIPAAIASTGKIIDWFMPRIEVEIYDFTMVNRQIKGVVVHTPHGPYENPELVDSVEPIKFNKGPKDWSRLKVNGVPYSEVMDDYSLRIEDGRIFCTLNDKITLKGSGQNQFDLMLYMGGFWVHSSQVVPQPLDMPFIRMDVFAGEPYTASAMTSGVKIPKQPEYVISFGDGSKQVVTASPRASHTYSKEGQYFATIMLYDKKTGKLVAGGMSTVVVNAAGLSDVEKSAIRQQQQMMQSQYGQVPMGGMVITGAPMDMPATTVTAEEHMEAAIREMEASGATPEQIEEAKKQMRQMYQQLDQDAVQKK